MSHALQFYIDGAWVDPAELKRLAVIDPSTEEPCGEIAIGSAEDVDKAVAAARRAFESFSLTSREERLALLRRLQTIYERRLDELGAVISREMGAPLPFARNGRPASACAISKRRSRRWRRSASRNRAARPWCSRSRSASSA